MVSSSQGGAAIALAGSGPGSGALAKTDDVRRVHAELASRCTRGDVSTVLQVLDAYPAQISAAVAEDATSLHLAVRGGHLALTRELLARGAEVNARDSHKRTPLHVACEEQHADVALELLFVKAEVNATDVLGHTALHRAVFAGNVEVLQVLLEHGRANASLGDDGVGATPLMFAAELGKADLVAYLVEQDPSLASAANQSGWTALHLAAHGREMRKRSVSECRFGKFARCVRSILDAKANPDSHDEDRKTPLHRAAAAGNMETAGELLRGGADVQAMDNCRWTPLHYACQDGHLQCAKLLLDAKAQVQNENSPCLTPLAVATMENQVKMAELLMSYGADPNLRGKGVKSPMMIARMDKERYDEVLSLFELGWIKHGS